MSLFVCSKSKKKHNYNLIGSDWIGLEAAMPEGCNCRSHEGEKKI